MTNTQCQECGTNQYKARCEWLSDRAAKLEADNATLSDQLATAREQNRQLVETVKMMQSRAECARPVPRYCVKIMTSPHLSV